MNFSSGETRIEVKWRICDDESDREIWWAGTVFGDPDSRTVRYDARPDLGPQFCEAEILPVVFTCEYELHHPGMDGEEDVTMQWRFEGETRDADDVEEFDGPGDAIDIIRRRLLGEIETKPMDVQGILASKIHDALETFRDEIHREMLTAKDGVLSDQNAQEIISRVKNRLG